MYSNRQTGAPAFAQSAPSPSAVNSRNTAGERDYQSSEEYATDVIAKAAMKNKFLDFRNNLIPAQEKDYAMMHGIGGQSHAPRSTIKIMATDYSAGVKGNSVVVSCNVMPELFPIWMSVCERNFGNTGNASGTPGQNAAPLDFTDAINMVQIMTTATELPPSNDGNSYLAVPKGLIEDLTAELCGMRDFQVQNTQNRGTVQGVSSASTNVDYSYSQDRVNYYNPREDGLAPVSLLSVERKGFRPNGDVANLPWTIKIQNFFAKPITSAKGTVTYDSKAVADKKEVFVMLSDADMYRCCYRVTRFIEVWEYMNCIPVIRKGLAAREEKRRNVAGNG